MWNVVQSDLSSNCFNLVTSQNGGTSSLWWAQRGSGFFLSLQQFLTRQTRAMAVNGTFNLVADWLNILTEIYFTLKNLESEKSFLVWTGRRLASEWRSFWFFCCTNKSKRTLMGKVFAVEVEEMFRQPIIKILSGHMKSSIRNSFTSSSSLFKRRTRKKPKSRNTTSKSQSTLPPNIPIDLVPFMSQLSKMKSFELKIVTTTIYLKVDNSWL